MAEFREQFSLSKLYKLILELNFNMEVAYELMSRRYYRISET